MRNYVGEMIRMCCVARMQLFVQKNQTYNHHQHITHFDVPAQGKNQLYTNQSLFLKIYS